MYDLIFNKTDIYTKIPSYRGGVYLIENCDGEILYIGQAQDLRNRVKSHFTGKSKNTYHFHKEMYKFGLIFLPSPDNRNIVERTFVLKLKPKYNICLTKDKDVFGKDANELYEIIISQLQQSVPSH